MPVCRVVLFFPHVAFQKLQPDAAAQWVGSHPGSILLRYSSTKVSEQNSQPTRAFMVPRT